MNIREKYTEYILGTYKPSIFFEKGQGSYLWDDEGKKYLDFGTGISVCNVGHSHPKVAKAISDQATKLLHVSNLYMTENAPLLAEKISKAGFGGKVFFCNSGAEANEGLIKFARKWGSDKGRHEIICMNDSFHGRTLASLAATGRSQYRKGFGPDLQGFTHVDYGDLEAIKNTISDKTAAVMLEPVLGEGGVRPAAKAFIQGVRQLCDEAGVLLMFDEVQTGIGRTGKMFAHQHFDVEPDIMSMAKALGNGMPIGAFMVQAKYEGILVPGTHATTFGGTPLACAAGLAVFEIFEAEKVLENCVKQSGKLSSFLNGLVDKYSFVTEVRSLGMMIGIDVEIPTGDVVSKAFDKGLILLTAGEKTVRLLPPLNISDAELDEGMNIISQTFEELNHG
ncbi:MAG: aspartate aminotransferase family protein [Lentisphaeraceae bacterium]|nr:aspartate aminotransferase family protein [Lentisphaeraceae bacterium]